MVEFEKTNDEKNATHIYVFKGSDGIVEGITGGNFYKLNEDKRTVIDDDDKLNLAWNMTDYVFIVVNEMV